MKEIDVRILRGNSNRYQLRLIAVALLAPVVLTAVGLDLVLARNFLAVMVPALLAMVP